MSSSSDRVTRQVLDAALTLFARHGFQRTSMADVAAEAGVSRATLYLRFSDKRALFAGLAARIVDEVLAAAEAAWVPGASLAENLAATLLAKDGPMHHLLHGSPHGAELLALDAELTRAHAARMNAGILALLTRRGVEAERGGADLETFDGAEGFARFLCAAGAGLKHELPAEPDYRAAVRRLCAVTARAAEPSPLSQAPVTQERRA